ncbi:MAG TPA: dienelactone hydrolase family protein [Puia sp.]|nr:dienelactone hydrolase family protein [Puia sp.]
MHKKEFVAAGVSLDIAQKVLIMLHGRGADADDILGLAEELNLSGFALIAPEANANSWYPHSFLSPPSLNEPWLSSALNLLKEITEDLNSKGIENEYIYFLGFSQGACLTLEFTSRHADKYGGIVAFTGGLIGDHIYPENYKGNFSGTRILLASSDPDPHVPAERVSSSSKLLSGMNANVKLVFYKGMGHTISSEEIEVANEFIFR